MAPPQPPSGPRRWDAQAQRWVVDQAPAGPQTGAQAGPPPGGVQGLPPLPPQPPTAPTPPYGPPPGPPQPGHGAADRPRGRWLTPATAGIAVASVAIGAAAVWFVARDTGDADRAGEKNGTVTSGAPTGSGGGPSTATGAPSTGSGPTRTPTPSPTGTGTGPGAGAHETKQDAAGFTIAVPAGWAREELKEGVFYRSADRSALIQVFRVSEPELSPLQAVKQASTYLRGGTRGYEEISVGPVSGSPNAAELVYQYDSEESRGVRRGVERVFLAADGTKWALLTAGPVAEWQVTQDHHAAALAAFRPTG
ncbi:hypothetical protein [Streptomyces virginiae]|uniref:hypothetical protein n=1 Tax=Streptomyces virginiae TaxID=1961 RepID=UPI003613AAB6